MAVVGPHRLPDFIIGGAMKSGTTSIHHLLGSHPAVFIPDAELFFFDSDDVVQHPQLLRRGFELPDYEEERHRRLRRYGAWFDDAAEGQLIGEDTTTYLASDRAPDRISELLPDVRLIFVLRDPVDRAYSHYWHLVRHGRAFFDFEATLEHMTGTIVQRGLYQRQLERYLARFGRDQVHVIVFEDFRASPQTVVDELCTFLGLPPEVRVPAGGERRNPGTAVRHPTLLRAVNLGLRGRSRAPQTPAAPPTAAPSAVGGTRWVKALMFDGGASYPPLAPEVRERLGRFYARENAGLADMLDRDPATLWPVVGD